jgi:hypothetical protein
VHHWWRPTLLEVAVVLTVWPQAFLLAVTIALCAAVGAIRALTAITRLLLPRKGRHR